MYRFSDLEDTKYTIRYLRLAPTTQVFKTPSKQQKAKLRIHIVSRNSIQSIHLDSLQLAHVHPMQHPYVYTRVHISLSVQLLQDVRQRSDLLFRNYVEAVRHADAANLAKRLV